MHGVSLLGWANRHERQAGQLWITSFIVDNHKKDSGDRRCRGAPLVGEETSRRDTRLSARDTHAARARHTRAEGATRAARRRDTPEEGSGQGG